MAIRTRTATRSRRKTSADAIVAEAIEKSFGDVRALAGIDLVVPEGSVVGLLGPNGAGKTTFVRILTTLLTADAGRATVLGYDVMRQADLVRASIGLTGQFTAVDEYLTGAEFLRMVGRLYHMETADARPRAAELLEEFGLGDAKDRVVKTYSGGMQRRLDLAASLMNRPRVLFLDEPTTGLDPAGRSDMWDTIRGLVRGGMTLLLTTQYLEEADQLADRIAIIDHGRIIADGTREELVRSTLGKSRVLTVDSGAPLPEGLRQKLAERGATMKASAAVVPVEEPAKDVPEILDLFRREETPVADLRLATASLESVFLHLTGRDLRE